MTPQLRCRRFARPFAASVAALALASPSASAAPTERFLEPPSSCEAQVVAKYRVPARVPVPPSCEAQSLASRGSGAPARSATTAATPTEARTFPGLAARARLAASTAAPAPHVQPIDSGFDWPSAAVGAGAAAGLLALAWLGAMAASRRGRVRTAR